ncbi:membrane peptidase [Bergeriella denitrificans]|uniref:Membrane peptidase n=2 Tax=Bergeriella denitrificans TaxID=494 RepID=A0A378UIX6_BERDE|nr:membrane peptidase [Bergeriella denitrificans]
MLAACAGSGTSAKKTAPTATRIVPDGHYRVQPGDTLYRIAKRYGQSVNTLAAWNNLSDVSKIEVGQILRVRRNASGATSSVAGARTVTPVNRLSLQWPTDNARSNIIRYYNAQTNKGLDIGGLPGQSVKAAAAGKVLYVGEGVRGYGKLILISHNSNTITAYAHNDTLLVRENQSVRAGQVIANMGSSDAERVKLHFEVRINGKAVDPMPYLPN